MSTRRPVFPLPRTAFPTILLGLSLLLSCAALLHATPGDTLRNTWVTGTVYYGKTNRDFQHRDSLTVKIYRNGVRIAVAPCANGLFRVNLAGIAKPQDLIEVVIWRGKETGTTVHSGKTIRTYVQYAQNLEMEISYHRYRFGYPPRRCCRRLYINNI